MKTNDAPFLVVATAGATNSGVIDHIAELARIASKENLWYHVDAAWGGAARIRSGITIRNWRGSSTADSITFDAHKWLSVPMGAGIYHYPASPLWTRRSAYKRPTCQKTLRAWTLSIRI